MIVDEYFNLVGRRCVRVLGSASGTLAYQTVISILTADLYYHLHFRHFRRWLRLHYFVKMQESLPFFAVFGPFTPSVAIIAQLVDFFYRFPP